MTESPLASVATRGCEARAPAGETFRVIPSAPRFVIVSACTRGLVKLPWLSQVKTVSPLKSLAMSGEVKVEAPAIWN
jgi:hypothetical protein